MIIKTSVLYRTRGEEVEGKIQNRKLILLYKDESEGNYKNNYTFKCKLTDFAYSKTGRFINDEVESSKDITEMVKIEHGQEFTLKHYNRTDCKYVGVDIDNTIYSVLDIDLSNRR